jgi:hypothetical protein
MTDLQMHDAAALLLARESQNQRERMRLLDKLRP